MQRKPRIYTRCEVELERLGQRAAGESENLSRGGVFVRTQVAIAPGSVVELVIRLPGGGDLCVISKVVHVLDAKTARTLGRHPGIGFEFVDEDDGVYEALARYLEAAGEQGPAPSHTIRVLVVEPSLPFQERLQNALEPSGFGFHAVTTGIEALALCHKRTPDVLVARARMPAPDGIELARRLNNDPARQPIPVLVLSRAASDMVRLAAYRAGAREVLDEPFTDEELVIRLRRMWSESSRAAVILEEITLDEPDSTLDEVEEALEILTETVDSEPDLDIIEGEPMSDPEIAALQPEIQPSPAGLSGDLAQLSLATVLSILDLERKSGVLSVAGATTEVSIEVEGGLIIEVDGKTGDDARAALMDVLDCETGRFTFSARDSRGGDVSDQDGLSIQPVLLDHARVRDERAAAKASAEE